MVALTRIFYPVGFGAFYTERHQSENGTMTFVYDCGTKTSGVDLENIIKSAFPKQGDIIDILFISHFHEDHVSGVEFLKKHCKIEKVVIPYIPEGDRMLFVLTEDLGGYSQLILNTERYFGQDTKVIRVMSEYQQMVDVPGGNIVQSGSTLELPPNISKWKLIPFNYNYAYKITELKDKLSESGLSYEALREKGYIKNNFNRIMGAYRGLKNNLNNTSLVLLSGAMYDCNWMCGLYKNVHISLNSPNCIFSGDAPMKMKKFKKRLKTLLKLYPNSMSTIQIPHHGSSWNFDDSILSPYSASVISYDHADKKHPSASVLENIEKSGSFLFSVTEDISTTFIEYGFY